MPLIYKETYDAGLVRIRAHITAAEVVAIGAATTGEVALGVVVPAGAVVTRARIENAGAAAETLATLTAAMGDTGNPDEQLVHATVHAANAVNETAPVLPLAAKTASWTPVVEFTGDANLSTMTGATAGFDAFIEYRELQAA